ncbi:hypothetical protein KKG46_02955 [Patescibacteria group bacterium]|nr:hypothetical protein [Patescibacteria group bacterium]
MTEKIPQPEVDIKQQEIEKIGTKLTQKLAGVRGLQNQKNHLVKLTNDENNSQLFLDENSFTSLITSIEEYQGNDLANFAAEQVCKIWEQEGKFSDPLKYSIELFKRDRIKKGYIVINEVFYYGVADGIAHIHLNNPYTYIDKQTAGSDIVVFRSFLKGLSKFALEIQDNPDVKEITATSELLANPAMKKFLESLGFEYKGHVSDTEQKHFDTNKDARHMSAKKNRIHRCG